MTITGGNINYGAFSRCSSITSVVIGDSVTSIGNGAFSGCNSLESITLPFIGAELDGIENNYFGYIFGASTYYSNNIYVPTKLEKVVITGTGKIGSYAFYNCKNLKNVAFEEGCQLSSIGDNAFAGCSNLKSIVVPKTVTNIGRKIFMDCSSLETITVDARNKIYDSREGCNGIIETSTNTLVLGCKNTIIPLSVTSIGNYAFSGCSSVTKIEILNSVTSIGKAAFSGCSSLESITLPFVGDSIKTSTDTYQYPFGYIFGTTSYEGGVATRQYYYGSSITSPTDSTYYIPSTLKEVTITGGNINCGAFFGCSSITSVVIGDSVTSIGKWAFEDCDGLTSIIIPSTVTSIGQTVFYGCNSLESIMLPYIPGGYLGYIFGASWYSNNNDYVPTSLKEVIITGGTSIGNNAFSGCSSLTSIVIPKTATEIGDFAFLGCSSLIGIEISDSVTSIGEAALSGCSSLESITLPFVGKITKTSSATYEYPFGYIFGTSSYTGGLATKQSYIDTEKRINKNITYYIPSTLKEVIILGGKSINYGAFYNCNSLTNISIPSSVISIGDGGFYNCSSLEKVKYNGTIEDWCKISFENSYSNPMYYAKHFYMLDANNEYYELKKLEIPNTITSIGDYQFYGFENVSTITIPSNVTSIESFAFEGCSGEIIWESPSISNLGKYCFYGYNGTDLVIPSSVTSIDSYAFGHCTSLTSIVIPKTVTIIEEGVFRGCKSLENVIFEDGIQLTSINSDEFANCTSLTSIEIPNSVTSIDLNAFYNCTSLTSIEIPDSVTSIGNSTFSGCSSLETIMLPYIPGGYLGYIFGADSYSYNDDYVPTSLKEVIITGGTSIGKYTFYNCGSLESIVIPSSVTSIGLSAFSGCCSLSYYEYSNAYYLGNSDNNYLVLIGLIDKTVTAFNFTEYTKIIYSDAFSNCTALENIVIPNSVINIGEGAFSGCSSLESITIPFVGDSKKTSKDEYQYPFGYIFGTSSYTGGVATTQYYYYNPSAYNTTHDIYYIPSTLKEVTINGGDLNYGAFYNCNSLVSVTMHEEVNNIRRNVFVNCESLASISIPSSVKSIGTDTFYNCNSLKYYKNNNAYYLGNANNNYLVLMGLIDKTITSFEVLEDTKIIYTNVFSQCSSLTSISIPSSVTSIGNGAFSGCSSLTSISIPSSVTSIGNGAFSGCSSLTSISIPSSVTSIGNGAFSGCSSLESITLPFVGDSVKESTDTYQYPLGYIFGTSSYEGGEATTQRYYGSSTTSTTSSEYYIPSTLKEVTITGGNINYGAFYNCRNFTNVVLGDYVRNIETKSFYNCRSLTSVVIGDQVKIIKSEAFSDCDSLTNVDILSSSIEIGDKAFYDCVSLTSFKISKGVISIGEYAFSGCTSLIEVLFEEGSQLTSIGNQAFYYCLNLTSITIPNSVSNIGTGAFRDCDSLSEVLCEEGSQLTSIGDRVFYSCGNLTNITIPTSVTSIGEEAFYYCNSLTSIIIPSSVMEIGKFAFTGCDALTSIKVEQNNDVYDSRDNCNSVIESNNNKIIFGCRTSMIPKTVTEIGEYAFYSCVNLMSITISSNVTSIGSYAFTECTKLVNVTFEEGSQLMSIGNYTFSGCSSLESIIIPNSLTSIGSYAFNGCTKLVNVTFEEGSQLMSIGECAFKGCSALTHIEIPNSVMNIWVNAFSGCSLLESITLPFIGNQLDGIENTHFGYIFGASAYTSQYSYVPKTLKEVIINGTSNISSYAFYNCSNLTDVRFEEESQVTSIGSSAFEGCSSLTSITIPNSVTSIGSYAFNGCTKLVNVTFEEGSQLMSIGNYAFSGCGSLESITIPNLVTSIGKYAFKNCISLGGLLFELDNEEISIEENAFYGCTGLTSIEIPDSVTSIGIGAFENCSNLVSISLPYLGKTIDSDDNDNHFGYIFGANSRSDNAEFVPNSLIKLTITSATSIGSSALEGCSSLTSITIPNSVTSIGSSALEGCSSLTSIAIPNSVTSIGYGAFKGCSSLESIIIPFVGAGVEETSDTHFGYIFGAGLYIYNIDYVPSNIKEVTITGGRSLGNCAFYQCENLTSIKLPSTLDTISSNAFNGCSSLTSIIVPNNVTSIGYQAFYGCSKLEQIVMPSSATYVEEYAFYGCENLNKIYYEGSLLEWYGITIEKENNYFKYATIYTYKELYTYGNYWHYDADGNPVVW